MKYKEGIFAIILSKGFIISNLLLVSTSIMYILSIFPLYLFTGASEFVKPSAESLTIYNNWVQIIDLLLNLWITAFLIWLPLLLLVFYFKNLNKHRKLIWMSCICFLLAAYVAYGSRIGAEWWNEYAFMIHELYTTTQEAN